jgi:hypothetical protein
VGQCLLKTGTNIRGYLISEQDIIKLKDRINDKPLIGERCQPDASDLIKFSTVNLHNADIIISDAYVKDKALYCTVKNINSNDSISSCITDVGIRALVNCNRIEIITFDSIPK